MEFWGVEVKAGEPFKVTPGDDMVLHLSQACLGEMKKEKGSEAVCLFVTVSGKKLVLGTLFSDKLPQQQFDLVFDRDFELSHNWKNGSVYFYGYKASNPYEDDAEIPGGESDDSESEEDIPLTIANNGKPEPKAKKEKPAEIEKAKASIGKEAAPSKQAVKNVLPKKEDVESSDDSMSEDDDDDSEDEDDSDDSDDESGESDEETPQKAGSSKKRAPQSTIKTPVQDKKAKVTPQRTDGKKVSSHVATPHPAKQGKTPANKPQQATPKSGGSVSCKSCSKTFGSEGALDSHTKAKHSTKK